MVCEHFVNEPFKDDLDPRLLRGQGGRNCPEMPRTRITLRIRRHRRWWPDKTLAAASEDLPGSVRLTAEYTCPGNSKMKVFSELITKGLKNKSRRVTVRC